MPKFSENSSERPVASIEMRYRSVEKKQDRSALKIIKLRRVERLWTRHWFRRSDVHLFEMYCV